MGRLTFLASFWTASDLATASCPLNADWSAVWMPVPEEQPQSLLPSWPSLLSLEPLPEEPPWLWSMSWSVSLSLSAFAFDDTVFDCETSPSSPGLKTRIEMFTFFGFSWTALESARAACLFTASWSAVCTPAWLAEQQSLLLPDAPWLWSTSWSVSLSFSASAFEETLLDWSTSPLSPFDPTRIGRLTFFGCFWTAAAV